MQHRARDSWAAFGDDDGIAFLDDALVELVDEPRRRPVLELVDEPTRPTGMLVVDDRPGRWRAPVDELEDAVTRVWIRPYAARLRAVGAR